MKKPEFRIYNSMTRQKEVFEPRVPGKVGMYVCGVTAYDYSHIGHARAYVAFDVLYRYLQHMGYDVNYVRNFTDVDDKIIRKANESGEDPLSLSRRYSEEFRLDMEALQCLPPAKEPRVSDHMDQIISMISQIINNGCAYDVEGDVFFSVDNFPEYGRLSGRKLEDNRAGERVSVDSRKRNPADFALWKSAKPGEPSWSSPWGPGRPGWHIECSAMSVHYLGPAFDIHGGGQDLIFPHHENEIAQSCAACAESNVKYWLHNGFVNVNNDKMSKSLGNFFTIRDVIERYHPLALRYFLMTTHYRSPVNYSLDQLELASDRLFYIYQTLSDCEMALSPFREGEQSGKIKDDVQKCLGKFRSDFQNAMADDLQTPPVLSSLADLLKAINNNNASLFKARKQPQQQKVAVQNLIALEKEVQNVLNILGLMPSSSVVEALQKLKDKALIRAEVTDEEISQQIAIRELARKNKEFKEADDIRARLEEVGIYLMDNTPQGTVWRPSIPPKFQQHQPPQSAAAAAGVA